jgi:hypothetical protein
MPGIYASPSPESSEDNPDKGVVIPVRNRFGYQFVQRLIIRRQLRRELQESSTEKPALPRPSQQFLLHVQILDVSPRIFEGVFYTTTPPSIFRPGKL